MPITHDAALTSPLDYRRDNCSVGLTLEVLGDRWSLLLLREAFYGVRRFADLERMLGCAKNVLSDRLGKLVEHGILRREAYKDEGQRERHEYRLTPMGLELFPIIVALMQWGDRWRAGPGGPPVEVLHRDCGAPVHVELRCDAGHGHLTARDTAPRPTAGAIARGPRGRSPRRRPASG